MRPLYMEVTFSHDTNLIMRKCDFHIEGPHCRQIRQDHRTAANSAEIKHLPIAVLCTTFFSRGVILMANVTYSLCLCTYLALL